MPATSKAQQKAAGAALAAKRGERPKSSLKGASKEMVGSMTREGAQGDGFDAAQRQARARLAEELIGRRLARRPRITRQAYCAASTAPRPAMT